MNKATWWIQEGRAGTYVRCELPGRHLPGNIEQLELTSPKLDGEHPDGSPRLTFHQQKGGAAIWCLPGNATRGAMMRAQQLNGTKTLVEVDDNYLVMAPHKTEWLKTIDEAGSHDYHSREAHVRIVQSVTDAVIVSTPYLEKRYRSRFDGDIHLCRNCVEPDDWQGFKKPDDGLLRIGWAASGSHAPDAELLDRAVRWLVRQPNVRLVLIGLQPPQWNDLPAERYPYTDDLREYREFISKLDVGFCPVKRNDWSASRSDLKALEYSMAGVMSIVSRNEPYDLWQDDQHSLSAGDAAGFFKAARWCVQHRDEVRSIANQAKDYVLAERTIQDNIWRWREAVAQEDE